MRVDVLEHGGFFGGVFFAGAGYFEAAAVPGVDCCFSAAEGVGVGYGEFSTKELCGARQDLIISILAVQIWNEYRPSARSSAQQ